MVAATEAGGTHPTGMHSCLVLLLTEMYRILIYIFPCSSFSESIVFLFSDISDPNCCYEAHGTPKYNTCKEKNN